MAIKTPHWPPITGHKSDIKLGLEGAHELLARLGNPHEKLPPVVHFAGTNGKGSTLSFLRAILESAGYKVHVYMSPNLVFFNERITLAGREISDEFLYETLEECRLAAGDDSQSSFFEGTTIAAFLAFSKVDADIVLLETGLGGRLDTTNVIEKPELTVITPISYDHMDFLGNSLDKIAFEKAGIIKNNVPCVVSKQGDVALEVLKTRAVELNSEIYSYGDGWKVEILAESESEDSYFSYKSNNAEYILPKPALDGVHQVENASTAIACTEKLSSKFNISEGDIKAGLLNVNHRARMQKLSEGELFKNLPNDIEIWLDGGHNEAAAETLADKMKIWQSENKDIYVVFAIIDGKDADKFLQLLKKYTKKLYCVDILGFDYAIDKEKLNDLALSKNINSEFSDSVKDAVDSIKENTTKSSVILVCGSLYLSGLVLSENR